MDSALKTLRLRTGAEDRSLKESGVALCDLAEQLMQDPDNPATIEQLLATHEALSHQIIQAVGEVAGNLESWNLHRVLRHISATTGDLAEAFNEIRVVTISKELAPAPRATLLAFDVLRNDPTAPDRAPYIKPPGQQLHKSPWGRYTEAELINKSSWEGFNRLEALRPPLIITAGYIYTDNRPGSTPVYCLTNLGELVADYILGTREHSATAGNTPLMARTA